MVEQFHWMGTLSKERNSPAVKRLLVWSYIAIIFGAMIPVLGFLSVVIGVGHPPTLLITAVAAVPIFAGFYLRRRAQQVRRTAEEESA